MGVCFSTSVEFYCKKKTNSGWASVNKKATEFEHRLNLVIYWKRLLTISKVIFYTLKLQASIYNACIKTGFIQKQRTKQ